ncbi:MAG TPA: SusC/RagA family TonB-linked outer membrane protein, partial [Flavitalea sp.]|nr:SusC/RagA family TonB-linked outer membrane protein [Flavitalea sp.]
MKLTAILLLTASLHVTAKGVSQTVTLSGKNIPLITVFGEIKKQTGYVVVTRLELIDKVNVRQVDANDQPLEEFIRDILKDQPFKFLIQDQTIFITQNEPVADLKVKTPPIVGIVRGRDGQPLAGVNILVKGTKRGTTSDAYGKFNIEANAGEVLVISSVGYGVKELKVNDDNNINVELELSTSPLDEVQVIAYGQTSKRFQTGNVSTIKSIDIEKQPINNPLLALQGRVPGIFIEQATGLPGSGVKVRVQGQNSLLSGNDPLYVIDGVPYSSQLLPTLSTILGTSGSGVAGNPLSFVNSSDIESIDILKDADATAIYGSRAANGAILITTKKGKAGEIRVNANIQSGWGKVAKKLDLMNTQQYLEMRHEALKNDGIGAPSATDYDLNGFWDSTRYTNWQKELIGRSAKYTDVQASVSGGNSNTNFTVGAGYHKETTVFPGNFSDQKGSVHFSLNSISHNQKFRIAVSATYLTDNNQLPDVDITEVALLLAPLHPSLHNPDGSLNWMPTPSGTSTVNNPLVESLRTYQIKTTNIIGNSILSYELLPGLEIVNSFGYTKLFSNDIKKTPLNFWKPEEQTSVPRIVEYGSNSITSWIIEPQLKFNRDLRSFKFQALLGATIQQNNSSGQQFTAYGFSSDDLMDDIRSAPFVNVLNTVNATYRYNAIYARGNINFADKYILNLTARRDGSSRFGSENLFHNFGAVGAAWIFSEERIFKNKLGCLSFGKIRASYGTTGSDQIS